MTKGGQPQGGGTWGGRGSREAMKIVKIYNRERQREGELFLLYNVWWFSLGMDAGSALCLSSSSPSIPLREKDTENKS